MVTRKSDIGLVVTDIDGTLVPIGTHVPSPATRKAMHAMHDAGVYVAAATARPYEAARALFLELGFTGPSVFDGGASIFDVGTSELLWKNWLSLSRLKTAADILLPHAVTVDFFPEYKMLPAAEVNADALTEEAPYAWAMVRESAFDEVIKQLKQLPDLNVHPGVGKPDQPGLIDVQITDINADKFHALTELRKLLNVSKQQTLAIGDSSNDIPLFDGAGLRIAMGNSIPELKALADHEVSTVDEDGWAEAMNRFVL